jgi:pimeloyl-ACP methyl ester carboxylesterase
MPERVTHFLSRDGLQLAADVSGDGERGTVILAHGGGQTRHSWASTAERLVALGWKAISLDLRGHGESEWAPNGDYQMQSFAEDLVAVSEGLPEKPALIGASLGGIAGLMVETIVSPGTFRSLTLVDIIPNSNPTGVAKVMGFMAANLDHGFEDLASAADSIAAYLPHRPRPTDLAGLRKNLRLGEDGRYRWHWDPKFVTGMSAGRSEGSPVDFEARCRDIEIPVHLIRGRLSEIVSFEAATAFVDGLRHGTFTDVANAGHMVAGDRNDIFLEAVVSFLD